MTPEQLKEAAQTSSPELIHEKELKLAKCIVRFSEIVVRIQEDLHPHVLCDYTYELCTTFTEFYNACYCVEKDPQTGKIVSINMHRLMLCQATAKVMEKSFYILGLNPVERM